MQAFRPWALSSLLQQLGCSSHLVQGQCRHLLRLLSHLQAVPEQQPWGVAQPQQNATGGQPCLPSVTQVMSSQRWLWPVHQTPESRICAPNNHSLLLASGAVGSSRHRHRCSSLGSTVPQLQLPVTAPCRHCSTHPSSSGRPGGSSSSAGSSSSSWVDRYLPSRCVPYAQLMRLDKPIGSWLLAWPGLW